jgi:hypothetical protein
MNTLIENDFYLQKWYMDCISYSGDVFIGYYALLRWKFLKLQYSNFLLYNENNGVSTFSSFKNNPPPEVKKSTIRWKPEKLRLEGQWDAIAIPFEREIIKTNDGSIIWECYQPLSEVRIDIGERKKITGLGYVEKIEMTLKPWLFPFKQLNWGRFHTETKYIVWVDFSGELNYSLLFFDGIPIEGCKIEEKRIMDNSGSLILTLSESKTLRKGPLISTVFSSLPGINKVIPSKILFIDETKYLSKGILNKENKLTGSGWSIHEIVNFNG